MGTMFAAGSIHSGVCEHIVSGIFSGQAVRPLFGAIDEQLGTPEGVLTCHLGTLANVFAWSTNSVENHVQSDRKATFCFCVATWRLDA